MTSPSYNKRSWWWKIADTRTLWPTLEVTCAETNYGYAWSSAGEVHCRTSITVRATPPVMWHFNLERYICYPSIAITQFSFTLFHSPCRVIWVHTHIRTTQMWILPGFSYNYVSIIMLSWICADEFPLSFFIIVIGPLQERQIGYMCRETLRGLEYLHRMGKMHRDIKVRQEVLHNINYQLLPWLVSYINDYDTVQYCDSCQHCSCFFREPIFS